MFPNYCVSQDYKEAQDPAKFKSEKTGRGPLVGKWQQSCNPVMTCYKLVTVEFKWFGLQTKVESMIQKVSISTIDVARTSWSRLPG